MTAIQVLEAALELGIYFLDTAPAYGKSEERLGKFLGNLHRSERENLIVETKFGEYWDEESGKSLVDHTLDGLLRSLDRSLSLLGGIDVLLLHKATPEALLSEGVACAFEEAKRSGVREIGASVSDSSSLQIAISMPDLSFIQFPYNLSNVSLSSGFSLCNRLGKRPVVNRPFNMGQLLHSDYSSDIQLDTATSAFEFVLQQPFGGFVLTGTKNVNHLRQNCLAFRRAKSDVSKP